MWLPQQIKADNVNSIHEDPPRWQGEVQAFLQSGMPRSEYCKKHNINPQQLLNWLGRHYEVSSNLIPVKVTDHLPTVMNRAILCHLDLPNGYSLDIYDATILGLAFSSLLKALNTKTDHVDPDYDTAF